MKRVADILLQGVERFGPRLALADPFESVTYAQLGVQASRLGRSLRGLGALPGERSLVVLPNSVNFVRAHFANLLAGLVSVPCDSNITADTLGSIAGSCRPRCLLTDQASLSRLTAQAPLPDCIKDVLLLDHAPLKTGGTAGVWISAEVCANQPSDLLDTPRGENEIASLMYTTGTTGRPKGVQLTHANILAALRSIVEFVGYTSDDREVVILPLSHNFGLGHVYCNLITGGAVYTENGLARVGRVLKAVESFGATGFPGTPMGFGMLIDQYAPVFAQKARNLRFSVVDSAPLPPERTKQIRELLPGLDIMVYYGLTEASRTAFISLSRCGPDYYRSVGRPMKHVEVQIRAPQGTALPSGETGEVVIRGAAVTPGYWNNPEENQTVFRDGWLHTGDLGHTDADGFLWITGRIKDVINTGGYKVNPSEVEKVLLTLPGVREAGVVGIEGLGKLTGESVVAALVTEPGFVLDEPEVQRHCIARLEKHKVPVRFVLVAEINRTNTGKIKRAELARLVAAAMAESSVPAA